MRKKIAFLTSVLAMMFLLACTTTKATVDKLSPKTSIEYYRENYKNGLSDKDEELLNDSGLSLFEDELIIDGNTYYYPVVLEDAVYFMADNSYLYKYELSDGVQELVEPCIHHEIDPSYEILMEEGLDGVLSYDFSRNRITYWSMLKRDFEVEVPAGAVYAGYSELEGYIFRCNSDVYSFKDKQVQKIATGVKLVIVADYGWTSDNFSQPLFLMESGELRVYCSEDRNQDGQTLYPVEEDGERRP